MTPALPNLFRNPVFEHEFLRYCKTRRWYVLRTSLAAGLAAVLCLFLLRGRGDVLAGNLDAIGRSLFAAACFTTAAFVLVATPGLMTDLVAAERRAGTIEVLLSTPLRPREIIAGKILSRIVLLVTTLLAAFPAISMVLLFGGVRPEQVAALFLTGAGLILLFAGASILLGAFSLRTGLAAAFSYLAATLAAAALTIPPDTGLPEPFGGLLLRLALPGADTDVVPTFLKDATALLLVGLFVFVVGTAVARFRLVALRRGESRSAARRRAGGAAAGALFDRRNPVMVWERRRVRGRVGRGPFWLVLGVLAAIEAAAFFAPGLVPAGEPKAHGLLVALECLLILLFTTLSGASTVVTDRQQRRIELFRLTDLTPREVVYGKASGVARGILPLCLVPLLHTAVNVEPDGILHLVGFAGILGLSVAICAADGVLNSIHASTLTGAILRSVWHFAWLSLFLPLTQMILAVVFEGELSMPAGPQFSILYPLHYTASGAMGAAGSAVDLFGTLFWVGLLAVMAFGAWVLLRGDGPARFAGRPAGRRAVELREAMAGEDWRENWSRLSAEWDEEG